jgi:hypothetical protein
MRTDTAKQKFQKYQTFLSIFLQSPNFCLIFIGPFCFIFFSCSLEFVKAEPTHQRHLYFPWSKVMSVSQQL